MALLLLGFVGVRSGVQLLRASVGGDRQDALQNMMQLGECVSVDPVSASPESFEALNLPGAVHYQRRR